MDQSEKGSAPECEKFQFPESLAECNKLLQKPFSKALRVCLGEVELTDASAAKLRMALPGARMLTHFLLVFSPLAPNILTSLLTGFSQSKFLKFLDLTGNNLGDEGAGLMANFMKKNRTLLWLNLGTNSIGNAGTEKIAESLEYNTNLAHLLLAENRFTNAVIESFLSALKVNKSLVSLDLGSVTSGRINSAIRQNTTARRLMFEFILAKPNIKTKFLTARINIFGEKDCGKSSFLDCLVKSEATSPDDKEKPSVLDVIDDALAFQNCPHVSNRRVKIIDKMGIWMDAPPENTCDFTSDHALKATAVMLSKNKLAKEKRSRERRGEKAEDSTPKKQLKIMSPRSLDKRPLERSWRETGAARGEAKTGASSSPLITSRNDIRRVPSARSEGSNISFAAPSVDTMSLDDDDSEGLEDLPAFRVAGSNSSRKGHRRTRESSKTLPSTIRTVKSMRSKATKSLRKTQRAINKKSSGFSFASRSSVIEEEDDAEDDNQPAFSPVPIPIDSPMIEEDEFFNDFDSPEAIPNIDERETTVDLKTYVNNLQTETELYYGSYGIDSVDISDEMLEEMNLNKSNVQKAFDRLRKEYNIKQVNRKLTSKSLGKGEEGYNNLRKTLGRKSTTFNGRLKRADSMRSTGSVIIPATANLRSHDPDSALRNYSKAFKQQQHDNIVQMINDRKMSRSQQRKAGLTRNFRKQVSFDLGGGSHGKVSIHRSRVGHIGSMRRAPSSASGVFSQSFSKSGLLKTKSFRGKSKGMRRTRSTKINRHNSKVDVNFVREFSDGFLSGMRSNPNGMTLNFWEYSDNQRHDSLYGGLYNNLMTSSRHNLNILCFDMSRFARDRSKAKESLRYYLQMSKVREHNDVKLMLIGLKVDRIRSNQEIKQIQNDIKEMGKELDIKMLINKQLKLSFFPVDNRKYFGHDPVRKTIESLAKSSEYAKCNVHLKDMAFLDMLVSSKTDEKNKSIGSLSIREVKFLADQVGIERENVNDLLKMFHASGMIYHARKSRRMRDVVLTDMTWFLTSVTNLLDDSLLRESYKILYRDELEERRMERLISQQQSRNSGYLEDGSANEKEDGNSDNGSVVEMLDENVEMSDDDVFDFDEEENDEVNTMIAEDEDERVERMLLNREMINHLVNEATEQDVEALITLMKDNFLLSEWLHACDDQILSNKSSSSRSTRLSKCEDTIYILPTMMTTVVQKKDQEQFDLEKDFCFQVMYENKSKLFFPSSFTSTFICSLVQFLSKFKNKLERSSRKGRQSSKTFKSVEVHLHHMASNETSSSNLLVEVNLGNLFRFFVRPEKKGVSMLVTEKDKKGTCGSLSVFQATLQQINTEVLKLNFKLDLLMGKPGDVVSVRKIVKGVKGSGGKKKIPVSQIIDNLLGVNTIKVSINELEGFLRQNP